MGFHAEIIKRNYVTVGGVTNADIYIQLIDDITGLPADGNGITAVFAMVTDGTQGAEQSVVIAGQSVLIYSGLVRQLQLSSGGTTIPDYPITSFVTAVFIRFGDVVSPSTLDPNLTIILINVTKCSANGATDGSITVTANSPYLPLSFSLDNITFQSSNIFTGLSQGNKTIYVKDGNNTNVNKVIYLGFISSLLISDPSKQIESNVSRWNAAFNPIVFTYQRKDIDVTSITNSSGNVQVNLNADVSQIPIYEYVYINSNQYEGAYRILSTGPNFLILDLPFVNSDTTGFINVNYLKKYYTILTKITFTDDNGKLKYLVSPNTPDTKGLCEVDLSTFLQTLLKAKDGSDYTLSNYRDKNLSASYQISYAESWDGNTPIYVNIATPYYVLFAAGQLGQKMAKNLAEFVPFATLTNVNNLARFVTDFKVPTLTNGFPFDLAFIYSEYLIGRSIVSKIEILDVNKNVISGSSSTASLLNEDASYLLNQDLSRLIIASYPIISTTGQPVPEQLGLNRLLINGSFPDQAYYLTVQLSYGSTVVTQKQLIKINKDDACNQVYLKWIGLTGSWNYFCFNFNQTVNLDVQNSVIIKRFVKDWESGDTLEDVISKSASEKIDVYAEDLTIDDIKGLQSIKTSPKVMKYEDGKWQTVVVNTGTFTEYETFYDKYQFKITFSNPTKNIQTQ